MCIKTLCVSLIILSAAQQFNESSGECRRECSFWLIWVQNRQLCVYTPLFINISTSATKWQQTLCKPLSTEPLSSLLGQWKEMYKDDTWIKFHCSPKSLKCDATYFTNIDTLSIFWRNFLSVHIFSPSPSCSLSLFEERLDGRAYPCTLSSTSCHALQCVVMPETMRVRDIGYLPFVLVGSK